MTDPYETWEPNRLRRAVRTALALTTAVGALLGGAIVLLAVQTVGWQRSR